MSEPVAIVTGAGKGIGRAIARELESRGHRLVLTARTEADLLEVSSDSLSPVLRGEGGGEGLGANERKLPPQAHSPSPQPSPRSTGEREREGALVIAGDVADASHVQRVVDEAMKRFGRIDVLVNNAGYAPLRLMDEITLDEWRRIIDVNLSATFYFCKVVWPIFGKQGGGVIVNISSAASRDPFKGFAAYGAAKAAVNLLGHVLAREGEDFGIRVHTIAPAAVETSMFRAIATKEQYPQEKTLDPAEVAAIVGQCVSGDLRHTSGEVIHVHKRL